MSSGSSDVTIGYKYFLGVHMALAHGPLDNINRIEVDRRIAWEGVNEGTSITVDAPELFGGDEREGGVSGTVDVEMGLPTQTQNSYLLSVLGSDLPAFRGVAATVLNQCYMGNNPYMKPWAFRAQRVFITTGGADQWYLDKAGIAAPDCEGTGYDCSAFRDALLANTDNAWGLEEADSNNLAVPITGALDMSLDLGPASVFSSDPVIDDACYSSWKRIDTGGGFSTYGAIVNFSGTTTDGYSGSMGGLARFYDTVFTGTSREHLERVFYLKRTSDNFTLKTIRIRASISSQYGTTYSPGLVLSINDLNGGNDHYSDHDISGSENLYHWHDLSFSVQLSGVSNDWYVTTNGYIRLDNVPVCSIERTSNRLAYPYAVHIEEGSASWFSGDSVDAYINNCYYNNTDLLAIERSSMGTAYEQNQVGYTGPECFNCSDMNPAHIIRECLTDTAWGMGYSSNDIDDTAFTAAADTLYTENMGISLLWHKEMPLEDFIAEILRHIDGVLYVDRTTGKFVLNLIRDDYQNDTAIVVLDETNVASISNAKRPTTGELTSSVTVNFWDRTTGETGSVTEHNWPLIQIQGAQTHTTIQYPGFTNYTIAQQVALRDLSALSTPLLSCRIEAGRDAAELNVGDAFVLDWPDLDINSLVMRVNQMTLGDGRDNTIIIEAVEDSFALPVARSESPEDGLWTDPVSGTPNDSVPRVITEAPYYEVVRKNGEINTNNIITNNAGAGFLLVAGGRQGVEQNSLLHVDSGSGYVKRGVMDFSPYAYLSAPIGETDTQIYIIGGTDLDLVSTPSIAQIGDELVRVDEIGTDSNGQYVVVGRGILDTVPAAHGLDSNTLDSNHTNQEDYIIFWDEDAASDSVEYSASESVSAKLQTVLGSSTMALDVAPVDSVTFNYRAVRPYPPGNLQIDGEAYPEANTSSEIYFASNHTISWAYRDRLQQTDGNLYDYTAGNIGPEAGTTYRIDIYSTLQDGTTTDPWWTVDAGQVTSYEMDSNTDTSRGEPPPDTELVHIKVTAVRGGYDSWQSPVATLSYVSDSNA